MAESFYLPYEYVDYLTNPGLPTTAGPVKLNQYLCKKIDNGGNDTARSFYNQFRWIRNEHGININQLVGKNAIDLALKGQGNEQTFIKIWNFMLKHKDLLDRYRVEVCDRRKGGEKQLIKKTKVSTRYFDKMSDRQALQKMVEDRFFGVDCIGFMANFLIYVGEIQKYPSVEPKNYPTFICKINISDIDDVKPLDFMVWNGHVAIVDWVWRKIDEKRIMIDMCQSSSGGPQCNEYVTLRRTNLKGEKGVRMFTIEGGTPNPPVKGHFSIWRREGFWY